MRLSRPSGPPPTRRTPRSQRILPEPRPLDPRVPIECKLKNFPKYTYFNWLHVIRNICEQLPVKYFIEIGGTTHRISTTWRADQQMGTCNLFFLENLFLQFEYNSNLSTLSGQLDWTNGSTGGKTFQWKQDKEKGVDELELKMDLMVLYHLKQLLSGNPVFSQRIQEWKDDSLEKLADYHRKRVKNYFQVAKDRCGFFRRNLGLDDKLEKLIVNYIAGSDRFEYDFYAINGDFPFHFHQEQTHRILAQKTFEVEPFSIYDELYGQWWEHFSTKLFNFQMNHFIKPRLEGKNWMVTVQSQYVLPTSRPIRSTELTRWSILQFGDSVGVLTILKGALSAALYSRRNEMREEPVHTAVDFYNLETLEQTIVDFLKLHKYYVLDKMKKKLLRKWEYWKQQEREHPGFIPNKPASSPPPQEHPGFTPNDPPSRPP